MKFSRRIQTGAILAAFCGNSLVLAQTYPPNTRLARVGTPAGIARPAYLSGSE
jgi:hypothetical protein